MCFREYVLTDSQSPESAQVLGDHKTGWFGPTGIHDLLQVANAPLESSMSFEDMFVCDPSAKHYGYKSWDGKQETLSHVNGSSISLGHLADE